LATSKSATRSILCSVTAARLHPDGQHIDVGGHPGSMDRIGALQIGFGGAHRLLRGF
jgi:hypothetical protein